MPTYEYICDHCGHQFEQFQPITARALRRCPECGNMGLKRLIGTGAGIIFKGSGFYETDYRSENYKKAANDDKGPADKGDSKDKAKTDTKTEPKTKESCSTKKSTPGADERKASA